MPALTPVHNTLGALLIGTILSSIIYGVTWLQIYSYYTSQSTRDRWPLKSFIGLLMLINSINMAFITYTTYHIGVTNFGDYRSLAFVPWSLPATALSGIVLEVSVQHFYAYRIYHLRGGSLYLPAAISVISLSAFGIEIAFCTKVLQHINEPGSHFLGLSIASLSCKVLCDVLITVGMVYTLLSNRTEVRRTNTVLNLLAIYTINCGTLNLLCSISCITLLAKARHSLIFAPSFFIMTRLYFCAFMSILNSRDNLRETLNGPKGVVDTFIHFKTPADTAVSSDAPDTTDASTEAAVPRSLPPVSLSDMSFSDSVITFDREKYPATPLPDTF